MQQSRESKNLTPNPFPLMEGERMGWTRVHIRLSDLPFQLLR